MYPSPPPLAHLGIAWPSEEPWPRTCLTRVGVSHDGGQVTALASVHRHEGCVLADDVAGLAGVHGVHLVAAAGPCRGRRGGVTVWSRKVLPDMEALEAKRRARSMVPSLELNKPLKLRSYQLAIKVI